MIPFGLVVWHLVMAVLLVVVWRLSVRLGRAMRDDVGPIVLLPVASGLFVVASAAWALAAIGPVWPWVGAGADVLGAGLGWYAAWHSWGWLVNELKGSSGD